MTQPPMPSAQERVYHALCILLTHEGVSYRTLHHEPILTSEDSARARGEDIRIGGRPWWSKWERTFVCFVLSAARKLNSIAIKEYFAEKKIRFASPEELLHLTGLVAGSIPPFGKPPPAV